MTIGDDLIAARQYIDVANARLSDVIASPRNDAASVISSLAIVRDGALSIKAKGIHRSAQNVIDALNGNSPPAQIDGRLIGLNNLLSQYLQGLDEIAPVEVSVVINAPIELSEKFKAARETLEPLISLAETDSQRSRLLRLTQLVVEPEAANSHKTKSGNISDVSLESLMPAITNHILAEARQSQKSVSVSYAVDDIVLPQTLAPLVQEFLEELGARLVVQSLETPAQREAAGLGACGLISITAGIERGKLSLKTECSGLAVARTQLPLNSLSALRDHGANIETLSAADGTRLSLTDIRLDGAGASDPALETPDIEDLAS